MRPRSFSFAMHDALFPRSFKAHRFLALGASFLLVALFGLLCVEQESYDGPHFASNWHGLAFFALALPVFFLLVGRFAFFTPRHPPLQHLTAALASLVLSFACLFVTLFFCSLSPTSNPVP